MWRGGALRVPKLPQGEQVGDLARPIFNLTAQFYPTAAHPEK